MINGKRFKSRASFEMNVKSFLEKVIWQKKEEKQRNVLNYRKANERVQIFYFLISGYAIIHLSFSAI